MKISLSIPLLTLLALTLIGCAKHSSITTSQTSNTRGNQMQLGAFSVSLAVKDLQTSHEFYKKLGFEQTGGDASQNWLVLRNGTTTIGLFHGMFDNNILTFNPGWSNLKDPLADFTDVRDIQRTLKNQGIELLVEADETTTGPTSFVIQDPDGNQILIDQHVPKPD